jgi:hypothetical protein
MGDLESDDPRPRRLSAGAREVVARLVDLYSDYANYQARTKREIPLAILSPS